MANKRRVYGPTVADVFSTFTDAQLKAVTILIAELEKSRIPETLYVVTTDGIRHTCGSGIYLIGAYDTKEKAQKVCEENQDWEAEVREITVNTTYPLTKDKYGDYENEHFLGGS